jgi:hypothetical protein
MTPEVASAWSALLTVFFGPANRLDWPSDQPVLAELIRLDEQLLARDPPGPVMLPFVDLQGNSSYYAAARDDDPARQLGEVIAAFVGPTSTSYTGRTLRPEPYDQVHGALVRFAGSPERVFRFDVVAADRRRVQAQVRRLLTTWTSRPSRTLGEVVPIGRLLDDFEDALERGEEERANHVLYEDLLHQGRLSGPNRIFLEARYLAAFEHWAVLDQLPDMDDLLRLRRPALVSDALARLALHQLDSAGVQEPEGEEPHDVAADAGRLAVFTDRVAARFGALVPSLDLVRSAVGAAYHVLWSLHAGEPGPDVAARLEGTPWRSDPLVALVLDETLGVAAPPDEEPEAAADRIDAVEGALAAGLYDRAIDLLEAAPVDLPLVGAVGRILRETLNLRATEVLRRYRLALGEDAVQVELDRIAAVAVPSVPDDHDPSLLVPEVVSWPETFRRLATGALTGRAANLEEIGFVELLRNGDELDGVIDALEAVDDEAVGLVVDEGFALCRRLEGADCDPDLISPLRRKLVEVWAIGDVSGQRRRAEVLLEQVEKLLRQGIGTGEYSDLVEQLTFGWAPFLTDHSVGLSLWAVELLAGFRPPADNALPAFALPVFSRIGPHNAGRISRPDLMVAVSLAAEYGLDLDVGDALSAAPVETHEAKLPSPFVIGLYSLDEPALRRAATLIRRDYPGVTVETASDKVATDSLRVLAKKADVFVMAELSSKHAATDAIKVARYPRPYAHAGGKGSSSLLRTVQEQIGQRLTELVG